MNDQLIQALVTVVSTFFGFEAVRRSVLSRMLNKVDVVTYAAKVTELHDTINALRTRVAILEDRSANR